MHKILIIEDDTDKIKRLAKYFDNADVTIKQSFQSGVLELKEKYQDYSLLVLDMTIPLWEKGNNDLGGNYEQFGGEKVLREMKRRKLFLPTVLFTMFDVFPTMDGTLTFQQIDAIFKHDFAEFYLGSVLFASDDNNWQQEMSNLISGTL